MKSAALIFAAVVMLPLASGVWLDLPTSGSKCVSEELHNKVVVMANYYSFYGEQDDVNNTVTPLISVKVTSPYGTDLYHKEKVSYGEFSFTTTEAGNFMACFSLESENPSGRKATIGIEWKTGIATKDWDAVAKKDKIDGLDLELRKLEGSIQAISQNLNHLSTREREMREVSETTNAKVAWYSIMSLGVCVVASVTQILYLRRYFRKKKLI